MPLPNPTENQIVQEQAAQDATLSAVQSVNPLPSYVSNEVWSQAVGSVEYVSNAYTVSKKDIEMSIGGSKGFLGLITDDEMKDQYNPTAIDIARQRRVSAVDEKHTGDVLWMSSKLYGSLPYLEAMGASALERGAEFAAAGAATGAVVGGGGATVALPFAAPITLPAGAASGAAIGAAGGATFGAREGMIETAFKLSAGHTYATQVMNGVDPKVAREAALVNGGIAGAMQGWFLNPVKSVMPLNAEAVKQTLSAVVLNASKNIGKAVIASDVTQAMSHIVDALTAMRDSHQPFPTAEQVQQGMAHATMQGLLFGAASEASSALLKGVVTAKGGPVESKARQLLAVLKQNKEEAQAKVQGLKEQLAIEKATEAVDKAKADIAEARAEGKPVGSKATALKLAEAKLEALSPPVVEEPVALKGHVEIVEEKKLSKYEQAYKELSAEVKRLEGKAAAVKGQLVGYQRKLNRQYVNLEGVSADERAKVNDLKEEVRSWEEAYKETQDQLTELVKVEQTKLVGKLRKVVNKTAPTKKGPANASRVTEEEEPILALYREAINDPIAARKHVSEMSALVPEEVSKNEVDIALRSHVFMQTAGYENFNPEQLNALINEIQNVFSTGKDRKRTQLEERKAELDALQVKVNDMARGGMSDQEIKLSKADNPIKRAAYITARIGDATHKTFPALLDTISQHSKDGHLSEVISISKEEDSEHRNLNEWLTKYVEIVSNGDDKVAKNFSEIVNSGTVTKTWGGYAKVITKDLGSYVKNKKVGIKGAGAEKTSTKSTVGIEEVEVVGDQLVMTANELLKLAMQFKDPDLRGRLEASGYTFRDDPNINPGDISTQQLIEEVLASNEIPSGVEIVDGTMSFYQKYGKERLNPWHKSKYGVPLNLDNKKYSGYAATDKADDGMEVDLMGPVMDRKGLTPSSVIDRVANKQKLATVDIFTDVNQHIYAFEHAIAYGDKSQELVRILANPEFKTIVEGKYGVPFYKILTSAYTNILGTRARREWLAFKWVDRMRRNMGSALVGGKGIQFFKQWTGAVYYAHEMPIPELVKGIAHALSHREEVASIMRESDFYLNRANDLRQLMTADTSRTYSKIASVDTAFTQASMFFVRTGDYSVLNTGGYAYFKYRYDQHTGTHEEKLEKAYADFSRVSKRLQGSSAISQRNELERTGGAYGKMAMLFRAPAVGPSELSSRAVREAAHDPTPEKIAKAGRAIAINWMAETMFKFIGRVGIVATSAAVSAIAGRSIADTDWSKEILDSMSQSFASPYTSRALYGDGIQYAVNETTNSLREAFGAPKGVKNYTPKGFPYAQFDDFVKFKRKVQASAEKFISSGQLPSFEEMLEAMHNFDKSAALLLTGIPFEAVVAPLRELTGSNKTKPAKKGKMFNPYE